MPLLQFVPNVVQSEYIIRYFRRVNRGEGLLYEKWLNVMKFSKTYGRLGVEIPGTLSEEEPINMAIKELQKINADEKMRRRMADREKEALDLAIIKGAVYNKGKEIGKIEGREEGQALEKLAIARKMLALQADIEFVKQATGLTEEELQKLTQP